MFAERPLAGNPLTVVLEADDVPEDRMLAFTREVNLSEATFVQSPREPGADYRNRIWDPGGELPFAGHPSLGTAVAVAVVRRADRADFVQETQAGLQPLSVERVGEVQWRASILQAPHTAGRPLDPTPLLAAVGLPREAAHPSLPPVFASTGYEHLLLPVAERRWIAAAHPDPVAVRRVIGPDAGVLYLVWIDADAPDARAAARGFTPLATVPEDPATGSAAGPLCGYLHDRLGRRAVEVEQGTDMGRPSVLQAELEGRGVRVAGSVQVVFEGSVLL